MILDKVVAQKILGSLQFAQEKGKGPNFLRPAAMKPRRSAQEMIEVKEEELQMQKDKLAYLRQVKEMKAKYKKEDEEEEKHAKQDEHPEPANIEQARQEM